MPGVVSLELSGRMATRAHHYRCGYERVLQNELRPQQLRDSLVNELLAKL